MSKSGKRFPLLSGGSTSSMDDIADHVDARSETRGQTLFVSSSTILPDQLAVMFTTPVEIAPPPGEGNVAFPVTALCQFKAGATPYDNPSKTLLTWGVDVTSGQAAAGTQMFGGGPAGSSAAASMTTYGIGASSDVTNLGLCVSTVVDMGPGGDGTLVVSLVYGVVLGIK